MPLAFWMTRIISRVLLRSILLNVSARGLLGNVSSGLLLVLSWRITSWLLLRFLAVALWVLLVRLNAAQRQSWRLGSYVGSANPVIILLGRLLFAVSLWMCRRR